MATNISNPTVWHESGAGTLLFEAEKNELDSLLPSLYGYHLLQLAPESYQPLVSSSLINHKVLLSANDSLNNGTSFIKAHSNKLPIQSDSIDVVVLTHSLEQASNPHQVLREVYRVLRPEGHLVITGFNPFSMWGVRFFFKQIFAKKPWHTRLFSLGRIHDWLELLDFDVSGGKKFYFRPPLADSKFMEKLKFMDKVGAMLFPFFGGAYSIVAVKRVGTLTQVKPKWMRHAEDVWEDVEGVPSTFSRRVK